MARLRRIRDGAGDEGARVEAISWNEDGSFKEVVDDKPVVGCSLLVGSVTARTFSTKDYWITTPIISILEQVQTDEGLYVKFTTENSSYEFWK